MAKRKDDSAPTHNLCVKGRQARRGFFVQVGAAWVNAKGQARIELNPGTVLRWDDGLILVLFPAVPGGKVASGSLVDAELANTVGPVGPTRPE